jgi:C4-type Zn-finger protein
VNRLTWERIVVHDSGHYTFFSVKCPQCGKAVDGWHSVPDPKKLYYQREAYECLECGYSYFRHDRELTSGQATKLMTGLGNPYATMQCPQCRGKMNCYSRRYDVPSQKMLFQNVADRVCQECHHWQTESISQLTLEYVNRQRSCQEVPSLAHFPR